MGDLPLRTPTDRRLGGPLPPQLANRTHAHPRASHLATWGCPLVASSGVNPPFGGLSRSRGQVAYALLTRAPVVSGASSLLPLDLHVLGLSLAFILSQDQTLRCMNCFYFYILARCPYYSVCGIVGAHIPMRLPLPLHLCIFLLSRSISSKISLFVPTVPPSEGAFRFRKRVQKYGASSFPPNIFTSFFCGFPQIAVFQREKFWEEKSYCVNNDEHPHGIRLGKA